MTETQKKLINDPELLIDELIEGMISAHPDHLRLEGPTGRAIVAVNGPRDGKVGIVVGGGSGHEPAFAGYVGKGLADAAPLGNVFASPSPSQICDAGFAAEGGEGVVFLYGNYTGDVMNFEMAEEQLAKQGIRAQSFVVTDDIASAPADRIQERRGIAGGFFVFKVAGAAADLDLGFDAVLAAAQRANEVTRTMGVALSACSMPQTGKPNFHIPTGEMEIGMGIHGEPGIARVPAESADDVTDRLLAPIIEELALGAGAEVAVLVNGLGSTTLMELYILHRRVANVFAGLKVNIHKSWVGEYCTSLEMGGASISVIKLDDDLRRWLDHSCDTPALRVGQSEPVRPAGHHSKRSRQRDIAPKHQRSDNLVAGGTVTPELFRKMMEASADFIFEQSAHLSALDGKIGDGDHGVTMEIGWKAVVETVNATSPDATITELCEAIATAFLDAVGASAGPLYASGFSMAGKAVSNRLNLDAEAMVAWLAGMTEGIQSRGGAQCGDKTMVDAWAPAVDAARAALASGGSEAECLHAAATAAQDGVAATMDMQSRRGRSKKLGTRSIGHIDPGAASAAMLIGAWASAVQENVH